MARGTDKLVRAAIQMWDVQRKLFVSRYGQNLMDLFELPIRVVLSPFTLAWDFVGSAPRGFGVPEFASQLSFAAIFAVATMGTYDIALEMGKKVLCQPNCRTCNGWQALRCTMCKGTGKVHYQVKNFRSKSGEKPTPQSVAEAITENRAELLHLPSALDLSVPLPSKECPSCDGSGVMGCPECKHKFPLRISADDKPTIDGNLQLLNLLSSSNDWDYLSDHGTPWQAYNVMKKMDYPYENIVQSMKDPKIAAFWLITMPQVLGGFNYDEDIKKKIWWSYKESMRYDQLRDVVAKREPGWEHLQKALITLDPVRARDDPVVVKNVPYYKAKKALEAEVMKLDVPPRPPNWGALELPLNASSWTKEELKDPNKLLEMTTLLNAQREMADKILDSQWEAKWRQDKLNDLLKEKLQPYIQNVERDALPLPIVIHSNLEESKKKPKRRRWWLF